MPENNTVNPLTILGFLAEVRKRIPKAWIIAGATYSATVEAVSWRPDEVQVEYSIHVMRPTTMGEEKHYHIRSKSMAATLVELEEKIIDNPPQLTI